MQNKTSKEIEKYVTKKGEERKVIQQEIQKLNSKRKKYVLKKQEEKTDKKELESAMINAIKKQAQRKNYSW